MKRNNATAGDLPQLTVAAAAEYVGVHERTIERWIATGLLRAYKVGPRLVRIDQADLDALKRPIAVDAS